MTSQVQNIQAQFKLLLERGGKSVPENLELPTLLSTLGTILLDHETQIASLRARVNHLEKQMNEHHDVM